MSAPAFEINFDGLVGPTHNYAGLSYGNLASQKHGGAVSSPRRAALEGLAKMKLLADLGVRQAVLPPQERPDIAALRKLGFSGSDANILESARKQDPVLLAACCSASSMWAANAATVSPSTDTRDRRVHFTPANLVSQFHRSLEAPTTSAILRAIFSDESKFAHHPPLPAANQFGDEGAANHMRLAPSHAEAGIEVFVYGRSAWGTAPLSPTPVLRYSEEPDSSALDPALRRTSEPASGGPVRFPARQTLEASQAVARIHQLDPARTLFVRQNPIAIDAGAFHNDVVAVANENVLFFHELAFAESPDIAQTYRQLYSRDVVLIEVSDRDVSLADAVRSYLFNSQLVSLPDGTMALICPAECREIPSTQAYLARLLEMATHIRAVRYIDVRESMNNGGGPACLRLRVALTEAQIAATASGVFLTDALYVALVNWVERHYRDKLAADDLSDAKLLDESRMALDELTQLLGLGAIYPFQRD